MLRFFSATRTLITVKRSAGRASAKDRCWCRSPPIVGGRQLAGAKATTAAASLIVSIYCRERGGSGTSPRDCRRESSVGMCCTLLPSPVSYRARKQRPTVRHFLSEGELGERELAGEGERLESLNFIAHHEISAKADSGMNWKGRCERELSNWLVGNKAPGDEASPILIPRRTASVQGN